MVQRNRREEGAGGGGESLVLHTLFLHLAMLSTSIPGLQGHQRRGRGVRTMESDQVLEWEASLPALLLAPIQLSGPKTWAEAEKCRLLIGPGGKLPGFCEHMELFVTVSETLESNPLVYRWASWRSETMIFNKSHVSLVTIRTRILIFCFLTLLLTGQDRRGGSGTTYKDPHREVRTSNLYSWVCHQLG